MKVAGGQRANRLHRSGGRLARQNASCSDILASGRMADATLRISWTAGGAIGPWPTPRSLAVFLGWFDCQFHSTLLDLADQPLIDEEI